MVPDSSTEHRTSSAAEGATAAQAINLESTLPPPSWPLPHFQPVSATQANLGPCQDCNRELLQLEQQSQSILNVLASIHSCVVQMSARLDSSTGLLHQLSRSMRTQEPIITSSVDACRQLRADSDHNHHIHARTLRLELWAQSLPGQLAETPLPGSVAPTPDVAAATPELSSTFLTADGLLVASSD
eukprot:1329693-Amphidinium_carterae.1